MLLNELFSRLGLETDAASFAKGALAARGVEFALNKIAEAARFVTNTLKEATFGVIDEADALAKLAQRTGVSAQALQELGYAADLSDVSTEELANGFKFLSKNMVDAVNGSAEVKKTFKTLGVSLVDSNGKIRSTDEVFTELADKFAGMPETAAKSAYAMKVFGKSGAQLLPLLNEGADGLAVLRSEFQQLHGGFDDAFLENAQQFNDDVSRIKTAWGGVKSEIAQAVLPALQDIVSTSLEWVKANRELIRTKIREFVTGAVASVRDFVKNLKEWIAEQGGLGAVIDKVTNALRIFATFLAVREVLSFVAAIGEAVKWFNMLRVAIAANPIGLMITLLATAVTLWIENWDDIREFFEFVWDRITGGLTKGVQAIKDAFSAAFDWIVGKLEWLGEKTRAVIDKINPFSINDTSSSGVRGVRQDNPLIDRAIAMSHNPALGVVPPTLVERGTAPAANISMVSSPTLTITTHPGQSAEEIGKIAAAEIEKSNRTLLRETAGGL